MSAKWRALQHRHRYTYSSIIFPKSFTETLSLLPSQISSSFDFFAQLNELVSLNSTYSQLSQAKALSFSFTQLISSENVTEEVVRVASKLYLEILFLENSFPIHRTLISSLTKNKRFWHLISSCFESLCGKYGNGNLENKGKKKFLVSRAALSLMGLPKLGFLNDTVDRCAILVANDVIFGLNGVISDIECGLRPSPVVMEQCQEAMSCMYYLLQKFPNRFESTNIENAVRITLDVLKSSAFSRDCMVAAGVSFCAAMQSCLSHEELVYTIYKGFFEVSCNNDRNSDASGAKKLLPNGDLYLELRGFSDLSRLCMLRGILTSIPRNVLNKVIFNSSNCCNWTILYDGILPDLCMYCDNPSDSHFNFHVLTVTQICLQQIKTSISATDSDFSTDYVPLPEEMMTQILKIIWNNLKDPLSQTVRQVHLIFDLLLEIEASLPSRKDDSKRSKPFLLNIVHDLLKLGPRCKGRYVPLACVAKRFGASSILDMNPDLLFDTIYAYIDDDVCSSATSFLKNFLECLRDECWSNYGIDKGYKTFRDLSLPPLLQGLVSGNSKLRSNLNTYALPTILEIDSDSIFQMLAFISIRPNKEESVNLKIDQCVAVMVSLLKVSRSLALLEGDIDVDPATKGLDQAAHICIKGINVQIPIEWFILALTHADESLRIDAAESLFLNPKAASLPSSLELTLMREAIPLNMRCCSTQFQMKWTSLFRKFFSRVKTSLERQVKQGSWKPVSCNGDDEASDYKIIEHEAENLFQFMKWLSCFLLYSCYPSAPYERKTMAMELMLILINVWPTEKSLENHIYPYNEEFTSPKTTLCLVGSIVDSWDRLRENSFRILSHFPTPLPGILSRDSVKELIKWAKKIVLSPRVRESDAGALAFRLIFRKYVLDLQWVVKVSDNANNIYKSPVVEYIFSLVEWLREVVEEGEKDLAEACRKSFVHGVLLTLRYTFEELDWDSELVLSSNSEVRYMIEKLLDLVMRITALAIGVVSAGAWHMSYDMDDVEDDEIFEITGDDSLSADKSLNSDDDRPKEQVVMVGCWLAMKEVSLLLGTIVRKIPLPSGSISNFDESDAMLDLQQLEVIGNHFLQVLLKTKHNGAIDKTRAGFTALCNRLLCSNDPGLCKMTESWMDQLMEKTIAKGQTVDDVLRRSAGIPAAFIAFFLSEPEGTPKKLLPRALRWLIDIANDNFDMLQNNYVKRQDVQEYGNSSKIRDEGVIQTVHAFNVLKAAFNDANLGTDTSGFCAEAMILAMRSFASPYWEVRNSACLAYTALVRRMFGFLNVQKRESARHALTGLEFFHRYPALHPFLYNELKAATEPLNDKCHRCSESDSAKIIHPSLCPILILLSRLKPSLISSIANDILDPFILTPFIQKCATENNLRVRVFASRALVGLVSNEKLHGVLISIAQGLPHENTHHLSFNSIHGTLLLLSSLLNNNLCRLSDLSKKDEIVGQLITILLKSSWIANIKLCPCPTLNCSYLRVLNHMIDIARTLNTKDHAHTIQNLLMVLASECLNTQELSGFSLHDPTRTELRLQAAVSFLGCVFEENIEVDQSSQSPNVSKADVCVDELNKKIMLLVSDASYEVRITTLKKIFQLVKTLNCDNNNSMISTWVNAYLQQLTMSRLDIEDNPKCLYYILKIIFSWHAMQFKSINTKLSNESIHNFWNRLVFLNNTVTRAKTLEFLICCMAISVKYFTILLQKTDFSDGKLLAEALSCIDYFVGIVQQHSLSSVPINMRKAAAKAIVASGLLQEAASVGSYMSKSGDFRFKLEEVNIYGGKILDLWFTCINLMEDEDFSLRQKLASDIQNYIDLRGHSCLSSQVDKVITMSFSYLSSIFGHWEKYLTCLCEYVMNSSGSVSSHGDLVRIIFDKEIDNHHEEKLLICQICCSHLEKLTLSDSFLQSWRLEFLRQLISFAKNCDNSEKNEDWIGGIGNHKDAFTPLYANLLAIYALSRNKSLEKIKSEGNKVYLLEFAEVREVIKPFLRNPLIFNLFSLVMLSHVKMNGIMSVETDDFSLSKGFDPYFLLR